MDFKDAIRAYAKSMGVSESEAKADVEAIIQADMKKGATREFAEASFIEEQEDMNPQELAEMEKRAKESGVTKAGRRTSYSLGGKKKRERKPNEEKRDIIKVLMSFLEGLHKLDEDEPCSGVDSVEIANPEREITFKVGENDYSITLICHRKPKK